MDDYAAIRVLLRIAVEEAGFVVCGEAQEGSEAVRLAHDLKPDLVTMDLAMPGMNGAEATRLITGSLGIPVLVISDVDSSELIGAAIEAGACWHVAKSDVVRELPLALSALLR
ncbi:MAG TPA: response regulator [Gaiellaceae bacterium]|nr:response regulator [Gaiellaceae bacterium]